MSTIDVSRSEDTLVEMNFEEFIPFIEKVESADDVELAKYVEHLRNFFLHGKKTSEGLQINVEPVLLAPSLREETAILNYPVLYDYKTNNIISVKNWLEDIIMDVFDSEEANLLIQDIPIILAILMEKLSEKGAISKYKSQITEIIDAIRKRGDNFEDQENFNKKCDKLEKSLVTTEGTFIDFSALSVFEILNLQIKIREDQNKVFLKRLKKSISGLNEILRLYTDEKDITKSHFDFAGDLVSFDKIKDFSLPDVGSSISEERLDRLKNCHETLLKAQENYTKSGTTIIVSNELNKAYALNKSLQDATFELTSDDTCAVARSFYKNEIQQFIKVVAAMRIAELEINQQYDEKLHAPYFDHFDLAYLSDDDIQYFRSVIIVEESGHIMHQPKEFLALFSEGAHVKFLAINKIEDLLNSAGDKEFEDTSLEIASLAIFRRKACVYQLGTDDPDLLKDSFIKGLEAPYPVLWNILLVNPESRNAQLDYIRIKTAIDSRYFPRLVYDNIEGDTFSSHFDIGKNIQFDQSSPLFNIEIKTDTGKNSKEFYLTMADFFALEAENRMRFEIVPPKFQNDHLIPLANYLALSQKDQIGKIPFIWMVDETNQLIQAVIPISWLGLCRNRLDYWQFIQEMGGMDHAHWDNAIEKEKSKWEIQKASEIEELKLKLQEEFNQIRTKDLGIAINKMLNGLLGSNDQMDNLLTKPDKSIDSLPQVTHETVSEEIVKEVNNKELKTEESKTGVVKNEAWVESEDCTSCSDCTDALPSVFKYNKSKQAFVHNPKGGPYAKIVAAAEKCPAMCIHPGLPHDPNEPNLDKLVERAKRFN